MLRWLKTLELALVLLVADNQSISTYYPDNDDWIAIKVNKNILIIKISFIY